MEFVVYKNTFEIDYGFFVCLLNGIIILKGDFQDGFIFLIGTWYNLFNKHTCLNL